MIVDPEDFSTAGRYSKVGWEIAELGEGTGTVGPKIGRCATRSRRLRLETDADDIEWGHY